MYNRSDTPQQWSVHAEFTISHPGADDPENTPQTYAEQCDSGVRMKYSWNPPRANPWHPTESKPAENTFQKGNLVFSSTPQSPKRQYNFQQTPSNKLGVSVLDSSGYGSDLFSPSSTSTIRPYNRKCRSTCNITLTTVDEAARSEPCCNRTHSLRCQTPTLRCDQPQREPYYGCGDPWCHHETRHETETHSRSKCGSRSCSRERESKKDACVQTFEMVDKCTSPFLRADSASRDSQKEKKRRVPAYRRHNTEPIRKNCVSPSITPDSLDSAQSRRTNRSPRPKRSPAKSDKKSSASASDTKSDNSKKPRTVHIDVYCTGTEMESDSSSSNSSSNATTSTPQTVFESQQVRITHKQANNNDMPFNLKEIKGSSSTEKETAVVESDLDNASIGYPGKSSCSTIRDFGSSISSLPRSSWTNFSMSSCTVPDDFDSVANTSWKDTFSDVDSLLYSRSSFAADSLDFVPRKLLGKNASIDETPEIECKTFLQTPSPDLQQSDSFEYADLEDRLRIKKMEELLGKNKAPQWKSPQIERKNLLQLHKLGLNKKKLLGKSESKSDSDSDHSEKGWMFVKDDDKKLDRDNTFRTNKPSLLELSNRAKLSKISEPDKGSLSDSSTSPSARSPSAVSLIKKLTLDPTLRAPFTILPGQYTEQREIAKKFGNIVNVFRKPGHHVGPVRNPDCLCAHCQSYFEKTGFRNRTRSVGDPPSINWKQMDRLGESEQLGANEC